MPADLSRCPQTEAEATDWYFALIQRTLGTPATDWMFVMTNSNLPRNVYTPGLKADASWPVFGFTQMWSNGPRGRIFLPSATADENGYYTRQVQVIADKPGGVQGQEFVWAWRYISGHDYVPVTTADGGGTDPIPPQPPSGLTEAEVQAMIDDSIEQALGPVYALLGETVKLGERIGLRAANGQVLCAEGGGPSQAHQPFTLTSRPAVGAWESFHVEKGQG